MKKGGIKETCLVFFSDWYRFFRCVYVEKICRHFQSLFFLHIRLFFSLFFVLWTFKIFVNIINHDRRYLLNFKDYDFFEFLLWLQRVFVHRLFFNELFLILRFIFIVPNFYSYIKVLGIVPIGIIEHWKSSLSCDFILINIFKLKSQLV